MIDYEDNAKEILVTHEEGIGIKRALYIINTKTMQTQRDMNVVKLLNQLLDKLKQVNL